MKYFKTNEHAHEPSFPKEHDTNFEIRANIKGKVNILSLNPHHRESKTPVKNFNGVDRISIQPSYRIAIPTGLVFSIPVKFQLRITGNKLLGFNNGLVMLNGTDVYENDYNEELFVYLYNLSDTPVYMNDGDVIAYGVLNKVLDYDLENTDRKVAPKTYPPKTSPKHGIVDKDEEDE